MTETTTVNITIAHFKAMTISNICKMVQLQ